MKAFAKVLVSFIAITGLTAAVLATFAVLAIGSDGYLDPYYDE